MSNTSPVPTLSESRKRQLGIDPSNIIDGGRTKRRRATTTVVSPPTDSSGEDVEMGDSELTEQALRLWSTVKNFRDTEGRLVSADFLRLPSKRQYADYYQLIKRPICLEEIKTQIDASTYPSLQAVKQDLDTCFKNAKKYNLKDSGIWLDAKTLQKVVASEFLAITGQEEDAEIEDDDPDDEDGDDNLSEEGQVDLPKPPKRTRAPKTNNFLRSLKARLTKLTSKTDESGRIIAADFMVLPAKKSYPNYYSLIKRPIAFEQILKKLKRKQYSTPAEFVADVDLLFANAFAFNVEDSPIWKDALALQSYFKEIMTDFAMQQTLPTPPTIKLKVNGPQETVANGTNLRLRVPGASSTQAGRAGSHGSPSVAPAAQSSASGVHSVSQSPAPESPSRLLKSVRLRTLPIGRTMTLESQEGVRSWSFRLAGGIRERSLEIAAVEFQEQDSDSESESDNEEKMKQEEEESGPDELEEKQKASAKLKRNTRSTNKTITKKTSKANPKTKDQITIKVNGNKVPPLTPKHQDDIDHDKIGSVAGHTWQLALTTGKNTIEIGGNKGDTWKLYVDRL